MKKEIHPKNYRDVIFLDTSSGEKFLIGSTVETEKTDTWTDGKEYPVYEIEISSSSHPFYTGQAKVLDTAGRVEKFKARQEQAKGQAGRQVKKQTPQKAEKQEKAEKAQEKIKEKATEEVQGQEKKETAQEEN